jgi:hypothetical protein
LTTSQNELLTVDNSMIVIVTAITFGNTVVGALAMNLDQTRWLTPRKNVFVSVVTILSGLMIVAILSMRWYLIRRGALLRIVRVKK